VRVVIADDVRLLREGIASLVRDQGIEVVAQASTADELLAAVEEHDAHAGMAAAQLVRGLDPLVGPRRRHADVHDRHVGLVLVDRTE